MAVKDESMQRMREAGRRSVTKQSAEMAAYEQGRTQMWECVASSKGLRTNTAVSECRRKLVK